MKHERKQWEKKRGIYERAACLPAHVIGSSSPANNHRLFKNESLSKDMIYELIDKPGHYFERLGKFT